MPRSAKIALLITRLAMGWMFFYAGITKVLNPAWTSTGYLKGAKTFAFFYQWLANSSALPAVDFLNKWGLTLLGVSLIAGIAVRLSSVLGAALMALYYFPALTFPYIGTSSFLVDQHIIYALVLVFFATIRAGRVYGLETWCVSLPICARFPGLRKWLG